mmetsp:Transcript_76493/g.211280  ORF Transcript_76493/g.211280 Transcript_76493/m.211280 type:complete len:263 (-) Transcript_76493:103-891(-)
MSVQQRRTRIGVRCILAVVGGLLPAYAVLVPLPLLALHLDHIRPPGTLLSNIMAAAATYQSLYIMGFGVPILNMVFLLSEAGCHLRTCGVCRSAVNLFLALVTMACGTGLLTLLAFNFEDTAESFETWVHSLAHNLGTMVYFAGAGAAGWVHTSHIQPEAERLGLMHPVDSAWLNLLGRQITHGTLLAGAVRVLHLAWPLSWSYPMLAIECYVIGVAVTLSVLGHLRLFMHLDAIEPLLDLSFLAVLGPELVGAEATKTKVS